MSMNTNNLSNNIDSYNYSRDLSTRTAPREATGQPSTRPSRTTDSAPDRTGQVRQRDNVAGTSADGNILQVSETELDVVIAEANRSLRFSGTPRSFSYIKDEVTNIVTIRITDSKTDELIKEIPPEEHVAAIRKMWELNGLIVDEQL